MLTIAHRAGNSVAALRKALDAGVDVVEVDIRSDRGRNAHGWNSPDHPDHPDLGTSDGQGSPDHPTT